MSGDSPSKKVQEYDTCHQRNHAHSLSSFTDFPKVFGFPFFLAVISHSESTPISNSLSKRKNTSYPKSPNTSTQTPPSALLDPKGKHPKKILDPNPKVNIPKKKYPNPKVNIPTKIPPTIFQNPSPTSGLSLQRPQALGLPVAPPLALAASTRLPEAETTADRRAWYDSRL